jgi:iron-sulfur cluster repair protein YtfE (RIC family)
MVKLKTVTPLKRTESLRNLSRDHHYGLIFCWKIRTGLKNNIAAERIKAYADFYFKTDLAAHLQFEEEFIFPLLGNEHKTVLRAKADHEELRSLFQKSTDLPAVLSRLEKKLEEHIRFEERVLFMELQQAVPEHLILATITPTHKEPEEYWSDKFWSR